MTINPEDMCRVVEQLSDAEIAAINEMVPEWGYGPKHISTDLGISISESRALLQSLHRKGVLNFGHLMDDEGKLHGKGYWLDRFGEAVRQRLTESAQPCSP
ncbi:hypothetical protein AEAC466_04415 [Asticcacaulis sp. AC466]|uniref:hypothetical protein n=1 Tax=Asticcacaulis sp. AC466 TaxID=1282362 RepID=UPI0003C3F3CD|nr:hypothetical protein [Asticcacaulis sp. AC466]ESQ85414.1 hypothetical protein AEAC466_04415 [Asticcacaulis sp. AC466]